MADLSLPDFPVYYSSAMRLLQNQIFNFPYFHFT